MFGKVVRLATAIIVSELLIYAPLLSAEQSSLPPSDVAAPRITQEAISDSVKTGASQKLKVTVTDNVGVKSVTLFYRTLGTTEYKKVAMTRVGITDDFVVMLEREDIVVPGIEYYIQAMDLAGNTLLHGYPFSPLKINVTPTVVPEPKSEHAKAIEDEEEIITKQEPEPSKKTTNALTGNFNVFAGSKHMTDPFFENPETNSYIEYGILFDIKPGKWPVSIAIDRFKGNSLENTLLAFGDRAYSRTVETDVGVRKIWQTSPRQRIHLGGGISYIEAESENHDVTVRLLPIDVQDVSVDDKDNGLGLWFDICLYGTFGRHLNFGFDIRYSYAKVTLFEEEVNAGGIHGGLLLGVHF